MACDCEETTRRIEWVRVHLEHKAICTKCGQDVSSSEIIQENAPEPFNSLDLRGVKSLTNGKTP